jgi:hypothetical protein
LVKRVKSPLAGRARRARDIWARFRVAAARARARPNSTPARLPRTETGKSSAGATHVTCVAFSKDRAMQLDACLRSIERLAPYSGPIVVVYKATMTEFDDAYRLLDLNDRFRLVPQSADFRRDVIDAVDPASEYTVFHTDDDVFFRKPAATPMVPDEFAAFSLRLGKNTTYCYPLGRTQPVPSTAESGPIIAWDWTRAKDDFSYPMSLDGHVFRTRRLLQILARTQFANPNELEEELHYRRYLVPPNMLAFRESCLVSIPLNVVSSTHRNRAGEDPERSPWALNRRFLSGERIDFEAMDFSHVRGAHQEIPIVFKSLEA